MQKRGRKTTILTFLFFALCPLYWRLHADTWKNYNFWHFCFLRSAPYIADSMQTRGKTVFTSFVFCIFQLFSTQQHKPLLIWPERHSASSLHNSHHWPGRATSTTSQPMGSLHPYSPFQGISQLLSSIEIFDL